MDIMNRSTFSSPANHEDADCGSMSPDMRELLVEELADLYNTEEQLANSDGVVATTKAGPDAIVSQIGVSACAEQLGRDEAVEMLIATLEGESAAEEKLTGLAQSLPHQTAEK